MIRNKKSQIVLFIILGFVILVAGVFIFYARTNESIPQQIDTANRIEFTRSKINAYVESCVKSIGEESIFEVGQQGGYIYLPNYSEDDIKNNAFYFYLDKNIAPTKSIIENQISNYIDEELGFCLRNFEDFKSQGIEIKYENPKTNTTINPNSVSFKLNFPLKVKQGDSYVSINEFVKVLEKVRLGTIVNATQRLTEEQVKDFDSICLSCIIDLGIQNDLHFDMQRVGNSTVLFKIIDNNTIIDGFPYEFVFANKYRQPSCSNIPSDWSGEKLTSFLQGCLQLQINSYNYTLSIYTIPEQNVVAGKRFEYKVIAKGANVKFSDYTELFDINETTGLISFIPSAEDIGEQTIWISASDSLGNKDYSDFKLNIRSS